MLTLRKKQKQIGLNHMEAVTQNKWLGHQNETDTFCLPYDIKIKKKKQQKVLSLLKWKIGSGFEHFSVTTIESS